MSSAGPRMPFGIGSSDESSDDEAEIVIPKVLPKQLKGNRQVASTRKANCVNDSTLKQQKPGNRGAVKETCLICDNLLCTCIIYSLAR